MAEGEAY